MKSFVSILAAWLGAAAFLHADSSYLLIQGPFGSGASELTYKWQVDYPSGDLVTGQDLLNAVFGQPVLIGSYQDGLGDAAVPEYQSGNSSMGVDYAYYAQYDELLAISFTLGGTTVLQDPTFDPGWSYYVEGGGGASGSDYEGSPYPTDGNWYYSNDGANSRTLADGSFDGWLFGATGIDGEPTATIDNTSGTDLPQAGTFTTSTPTDIFTVVSVPEPSAPLLLGLALGAAAFWKRKAAA